MDASVWISLAGVGFTVVGGAVGFGMLKQQVSSLKETVEQDAGDSKDALAKVELRQVESLAKVEQRHNDAMLKLGDRITACEAGHANTSQEMNALRVDVAILTERSGATITSLDRIERHLSDRDRDQQPTTTRRRSVAK